MPTDSVSLDLLRTFHAIYRSGSLTRAAQVLGLSQPTVTDQLRNLERTVEARLFTRQARGVAPTAAAHDLAGRLDGPLDALIGVAAELGRPPALAGRTLHLGGPAELMTARILPALADTIRAGVAVRTRLGQTDDLLAELADGRLDLVVSTVRPRGRGLRYEPWWDEEFLLVAAPTLVAGIDQRLLQADPPRALRRLPLLAYAEELPIIRRWWRHVLGLPPTGRAVLVVPDLRALSAAAVAGIGATVLPRYLCADDLAVGRLVEMCGTDDPPINTLYLVTRAASWDHPHVAHAHAALRRAGRR